MSGNVPFLLLLTAGGSSAFLLAGRPTTPPVARAMVSLSGDKDTAGTGFGSPRKYVEEEERGRKALEALRAASAEQGYDSSLQGLQSKDGDEPIEVPEEFKSKVILGFAGFLIAGGVAALFAGGSLWEPKGFNEDGTPPPEETPAFGFVPSAPQAPPPAVPSASWAGE